MSSTNTNDPSSQASGIFINYRRRDTSGHAGRLEHDLSERFPGRVFMDIHNIEVGTDFTEAISDEVGKCGVLIVMIGDQWLDITDAKTGKRRLDDPNDFVSLEIAAALKRNIRVIPLLVEGAAMPQEADLPEALAGLVRRNALEISDTRWEYDVGQLIKVLEKVCGPAVATVTTRPAVTTTPGKSSGAKIALMSAVAAAVVAAIVVAFFVFGRKSTSQPTADTQPVNEESQEKAVTSVDGAKPPVDADESQTPEAASNSPENVEPTDDAIKPIEATKSIRPGYFLIGEGSPFKNDAQAISDTRNAEGLKTFVVDSSEWSNLNSSWSIVVYGIYDDEKAANNMKRALDSRGIKGLYVKHSGQRR